MHLLKIRATTIALVAGPLGLAACSGPKMDAGAAYDGSHDIVQAAKLGQEAAKRCREGGADGPDNCDHVDDSFQEILETASKLQTNAENAGGKK